MCADEARERERERLPADKVGEQQHGRSGARLTRHLGSRKGQVEHGRKKQKDRAGDPSAKGQRASRVSAVPPRRSNSCR